MIGTRLQVMRGTAKQTSGGLTNKDLVYNKYGKIVSKNKSNMSKKIYGGTTNTNSNTSLGQHLKNTGTQGAKNLATMVGNTTRHTKEVVNTTGMAAEHVAKTGEKATAVVSAAVGIVKQATEAAEKTATTKATQLSNRQNQNIIRKKQEELEKTTLVLKQMEQNTKVALNKAEKNTASQLRKANSNQRYQQFVNRKQKLEQKKRELKQLEQEREQLEQERQADIQSEILNEATKIAENNVRSIKLKQTINNTTQNQYINILDSKLNEILDAIKPIIGRPVYNRRGLTKAKNIEKQLNLYKLLKCKEIVDKLKTPTTNNDAIITGIIQQYNTNMNDVRLAAQVANIMNTGGLQHIIDKINSLD
jgi:hypothetical protein